MDGQTNRQNYNFSNMRLTLHAKNHRFHSPHGLGMVAFMVQLISSDSGTAVVYQIEAIMRQYKSVLVERAEKACPQQILLFSSRWTQKLRTFATEYMCEPLFIIASPMEMCYYGQVRQVHEYYCVTFYSVQLEIGKQNIIIYSG